MIAFIAAVARNGVIGKNQDLPWRIPEDWAYFKKMTMGKTMLMGRKTFESLGKPLPGRKHLVITRQTDYPAPPGVEVYQTIADALAAHPHEDIFVIGGGEIFREMLPLADTLYITHIDQDYDGDTFFPPIDPKIWKEISRDPKDGYSFVVYKHTQNN